MYTVVAFISHDYTQDKLKIVFVPSYIYLPNEK